MKRDGTVRMTFTTDTEVYRVRNKVWKAGGCLCISCLEGGSGVDCGQKTSSRGIHSTFQSYRAPIGYVIGAANERRAHQSDR
jgi:hypothetical protein